ncbi:hypothetical protein SAMN05443270_1485 [Lacrimispora sphenoides]|uniref:hypothetical protein n=1 Tax=Lacrimispora sphenoides TaxID=29370 RepID=UPI0008B3F7A8|nr:hypothetical protein [Lacrimispora sphenoides]SET80175.1 hypothetical protein SAMN05443270_1485 [Lacrimispora sphenoides]
MKALVIYDLTGRIWNIIYDTETIPQGLTCMWVDIPDGAQLKCVDVTDPENPKAVFTYLPESDMSKLQNQVRELREQNGLLIAQVAYLSMMSGFDVEEV